jgi:hypothetical protein
MDNIWFSLKKKKLYCNTPALKIVCFGYVNCPLVLYIYIYIHGKEELRRKKYFHGKNKMSL